MTAWTPTAAAIALFFSPATWGAGADPIAEVEPNDRRTSPQKVFAPCVVACTVDPRTHGGSDVFAFDVDAPGHLRIDVTGVEGVDFQLSLYGSERAPIARVDGQPEGRGEHYVTRVRRDTYILEIRTRAPKGVPETAAYTLTLQRPDLEAYTPSIEAIKAAIQRGLTYLAKTQGDDGAWRRQSIAHGITGLALMGFVAEDLLEFANTVQKAAGFFKKSAIPPGSYPKSAHQEASLGGSLVGARSGHFIYEQAIAVLAMSEYLHRHEDAATRKKVADGIQLLLRSQNTALKPRILGGPIPPKHDQFGGWKYLPKQTRGDLSVSGWCLIALAAAETAGFKTSPSLRKDYLVFCRRCYNEKLKRYAYEPGGMGLTTDTLNAVGTLTTLLCQEPADPLVAQGIKGLRRSLPHWQAEGERGSYPFYYWYYGSRAMYVAGGDYWKEWQAVVCPMLLKFQNDDGSWDVAASEKKIGKDYGTAVAVLILQLCSGKAPAYLKGLSAAKPRAAYSCPTCVGNIEDLLRKAKRDRSTKEQLIEQIQELIDQYRGE
ncbi:hypothetical protein HQ560_01505 [bacterium]|nr:hypothetical protein [bacterium]